ncbi:MAG: hypothetical protein PVSMB9_10020 [Candidatus Dormibacteria bacterium]
MARKWMDPAPDDEGLVDVLFVGGDTDLADMYRLKLELDGYRVRIVTTLRSWSGTRPDLVFLDLEEPDGAGLRELARLRADRRLSRVPAILLVRESEDDLEARGLKLTPQEYLLRARTGSRLTSIMVGEANAEPNFPVAPRFH